MNKGFLTGTIVVDIKNGSLNGSSDKIESSKLDVSNHSFTKKIGYGKEAQAYASANWVKYNIKQNAKELGQTIGNCAVKKSEKNKQQAIIEGNPYKNFDEDLFGFMKAEKEKLTEEDYNELDDITKKLYSKSKKEYTRNATKKRLACVQMSTLQTVKKGCVKEEFCTKATNATPLLFSKEVYSSLMTQTFNLDKSRIGVFTASKDQCGFRDYTLEEVTALELEEKDGVIELNKEDKKERINVFLDCIEYLNTHVRQTNNLEDLMPKFVILAEHKIAINPFMNLFNGGELNIEELKEIIEETNRFRNGKIYIGVRKGFLTQEKTLELENMKEELGQDVIITSVAKAFKGYKETL